MTINWKDYKLLDSGNGHKLEQWGDYITIRPEATAIWKPKQKWSSWKNQAHALFEYNNKRSGSWVMLKKMPKEWNLKYPLGDKEIVFSLELTRFKHVGLFPEQAANWEFIYQQLKKTPSAKVLNLFAYTGGATLAARAAGASVTHVDAIKQVITWSNKNMHLSHLNDIRWIVDDALKFTQKEKKRNVQYDMIILDPPTWGLGPKGEKWKLEDKIDDLLSAVSSILKDHYTVVMNTYSGLTPITMKNLCQFYFPKAKIESSTLLLSSANSYSISTGTVVRITK